jgi:hypothetical protein
MHAVADPFAAAHAFDGDDAAAERHDRLDRQRRRERRRNDAVQHQAGTHAVAPDARIAQQRRAVRRVHVRRALRARGSTRRTERGPIRSAKLVDLGQRALEPDALLVEERVGRIVGRREMRVDGRELEVRAGHQLGQRSLQVVEPEPEAVHPGIDLQVVPQPVLVARGGGLHGPRGAGRRDRRREPAVEHAVEIADAQRAEHENLDGDARGPQRRAFLDVGACEHIGACLFERARHLPRAVPVRIRLDDGDDAGRRGTGGLVMGRGTGALFMAKKGSRPPLRPPLAREVIDDGSVIGFQRAQINARNGGTNHEMRNAEC